MFAIPLDKTIEDILKFFYKTGILQRDDEPNYRKLGKKFAYIVACAFLPIFFAINFVLCDDQNESIFSVQGSLEAAIAYVKLLYMIFKKREVLAYLNNPIVRHSIECEEEREQTNVKIKKFMRLVRPYCIAVYITSVAISVIPIFTSYKVLPFFMSFSWNDSNIVFWLVYWILAVVTPCYGAINLSTALIWYITLNFSIEYELLGNKLRKLGNGKKTIETKVKTIRLTRRSEYVEDLIVCIKAHRHLSETIEGFRTFFSTLFFGQITTSGICICTSVYSMSFATRENIVQTEMHLIMLIHGILDIFVIMYLTNDITIASGRLSQCLFDSNWIDQTESCKKYILIMGEVLKQPQQLVILIYPMSLETFMRIANGAYSMFNILKSFQ